MFGTPCEDHKRQPVIERARWTASSSCTPTTSKNASTLHRAPVRLFRNQPFAAIAAGGWPAGVLPTAVALTKPASTCSKTSRRWVWPRSVSSWKRSRTRTGVKLHGLWPPRTRTTTPAPSSHAGDLQRSAARAGLGNDPLFKLAKQVEKIALEDDYFVQRKLYPNVDFYPASCSAPLVSRSTYSLASSPWPAPWVGLPN